MSSVWKNNLSLTLFGESHGEYIGGTLDGLPAGIKVDEEYLREFTKRRLSDGKTGTQRVENDEFEIISGVYNGFTTASPLTVIIRNRKASKNAEEYRIARPSHCDYTSFVRSDGFCDLRGGGHYSARLTAVTVFFGGILSAFLEEKGIRIASHILSVGEAQDIPFDPLCSDKDAVSMLKTKAFPVIDDTAGEKMREIMLECRNCGDTIGGEIECIVTGMEAGLGNPLFYGLDSTIAALAFSVPSVKSIEFGVKDAWKKRASTVNDEFAENNGKVYSTSNNSGGMNGGISSGMPLLFRVGMKPVPSISMEQKGLDLSTMQVESKTCKAPSDACQLVRSCVIIESVAAIAVADAIFGDLRKKR